VKVWRQAERPEPLPLPDRRVRARTRRRSTRPVSQAWRERARPRNR
jgi:hypothetical protein